MISRKIKRSISTTHITFGFAVLIILSLIIFYSKKDVVALPSILSNVISTASSIPQIDEPLLSRKARSDFEFLIATVLQVNSFESSVARDDTFVTSSIPDITTNHLVKIEDTINTLPGNDKKTFCSKLSTYSELLTKRVGDAKIKIADLFEKQARTISAEKLFREKKVERNRNLSDEQIGTYFTRLKNSLATSTSYTQLSALQTEIMIVINESRKKADLSTDSVSLGARDAIDIYQKKISKNLSGFEDITSKSLATAKNDCMEGVSPRVIRLSLHASLIVFKKNLFEAFSSVQNPHDEISKLLDVRNREIQITESGRLTLFKRLEKILETIPKR